MHRKYRNEKARKREARQSRVRTSIHSSPRVRLTVFRSARHIYAQLDDPISGRTLGTVSTRSKQLGGESGGAGNVEAAKKVGKAIAELAREKKIESVVFNRNGFLFHGRVKALAEAAREAGLQL
ncbi:MAG: 50S ribosomal protein L18 [Myxococcota bacterium]|nr:50S ribosomal protein L18 [Myxococcota bacterium]